MNLFPKCVIELQSLSYGLFLATRWLALPRTSGVNKEQLKPDGVTSTHLVANLIDAYSYLN
jgi:hypothetical protein